MLDEEAAREAGHAIMHSLKHSELRHCALQGAAADGSAVWQAAGWAPELQGWGTPQPAVPALACETLHPADLSAAEGEALLHAAFQAGHAAALRVWDTAPRHYTFPLGSRHEQRYTLQTVAGGDKVGKRGGWEALLGPAGCACSHKVDCRHTAHVMPPSPWRGPPGLLQCLPGLAAA